MTPTTTISSKIASALGRRRLAYSLRRAPAQRRVLSSSGSESWVTTKRLEDDDRIAILELNRKPANALSLEMCTEISAALHGLRENTDKPATAVVLASSLPSGIFSAGLDIPRELYKPDADRLPEFWRSFQQLFLDLYGCLDMTTVAALEGPSPAAGCMLALSCDYRAALDTPSAVLGLNESHLGIVAPPWMCQQYIDILGHRRAELALLSGLLFPPRQALEAGLIDELVDGNSNSNSDGEDGGYSPTQHAALQKAREFAGIPAGARAGAKKLTRGPLLETLARDRERDVDFFCQFVTSDPAQAAIGKYLEALAKKAAEKKKKK